MSESSVSFTRTILSLVYMLFVVDSNTRKHYHFLSVIEIFLLFLNLYSFMVYVNMSKWSKMINNLDTKILNALLDSSWTLFSFSLLNQLAVYLLEQKPRFSIKFSTARRWIIFFWKELFALLSFWWHCL